ncbi:patatin-like phospholipase family protein [Maribacter sp. 2307UL18-2]|uniref:patatin-like phospholipase family protein n=1 Tax=Maribacter sp. 2307UL18-2 TaxID=3386274 RepID=UPI0039BC8BAA
MNKPYHLIFVFFFTIFSSAQKEKKVDDLKVGLVLSGGGAKGLAHIGALKIIEEAGVQIDYIGGTSMGAIIGGLYAAGYSASELDSIFSVTDLGVLIQDNLPRNAKTFYEKEDSERYAVTLPFNNFKISVPSAFSGGQNIYNELARLLYHVRNTKDFDQLPIPFVCIATDIESGNEVVLKKGYLPEAIMASGTLPSLFAPAEIDDQILIDGGVVNNYPLEEVYKMGANVIIGVDVQHGLSDRESLSSFTEILLQINNFDAVDYMKEKSKKTTIYIKPPMEDYSVLDFAKNDTIIGLGQTAAKKLFEDLKSVSNPENKLQTQVTFLKPDDKMIINDLSFLGDKVNHSKKYIMGKLKFKLGDSITFKELQHGINNLVATRNFENIRYRLHSIDNVEELQLNLKESKNKSFIRFGAHYDELYRSAVLVNFTQKDVFTQDGLLSFDFIIGDRLRYEMEYYIDKGTNWSFGLNSRLNEFEKDIPYNILLNNYEVPNVEGVNNINLVVTDFTNQLYLTSKLGEELGITLGAEHKSLRYSTETISEVPNENENSEIEFSVDDDDRLLFEKSNYLSTFAQLKLDTYDDIYFPSKGVYFDSDIHLYLLASDFSDDFSEFAIAKAQLGLAMPITRNLSVNFELGGGFKIGTSDVNSFDFVLGGYGNNLINNFVPFFGYDFLSIPGNSYWKSSTTMDFEFTKKNHLIFSGNFAKVGDNLYREGDLFKGPVLSGFGVGYGFESFLGPIKIMYSAKEIEEGELFVSIGYWF